MDETIVEPINQSFEEMARAANCRVKCTSSCVVSFAAGEIRDAVLEKALEEAVKRAAKKTVKKFLLRAVPVYGQVTTVMSSGRAIKCTTDCWLK